MRLFYLCLALIAGALMPVQAGINARLKMAVADPALAALISFAVGTMALGVYVLVLRIPWPAATLAGGPWWMWTGGFMGAFFVAVTIVLAIKLGAASMMAWLLAGQFVASLLLDHYGMIGYAVREISWPRILGAVLLMVGAILMEKF